MNVQRVDVLNEIPAKTNDSLSKDTNLERLDVNDFVREAKLDLEVWFEYVIDSAI